MITPPPSWPRQVGHQLLVLDSPDGHGRIVYHERLSPRPFADIVDGLLGERFRRTVSGPPSRLVTEEGELGAWCSLAGVDGLGEARRWVGAVLCDEFVAAIDGMSRAPETDDLILRTTRWLIQHATFGLGIRRRRFVYRRPPGWQGLASGLIVSYLPPDYPRHRTVIEVHPAEPSAHSPDEAIEAIVDDEERRGLERIGPATASALPRAHPALPGRRFSYGGRWPGGEPQTFDVAILVDGRYRYLVRLERAGEEADLAVFLDLVASIEPLPLAGGRAVASAGSDDVTAPWLE